MPQIKSVVCRQACVACWSDVLVKNDETSVFYFLFEAILRCISRPVRTKNIQVLSQLDFIVIAVRAERLWNRTQTAHRQPTSTFAKCEEMSSGMVNTMNFQYFIEVGIYSQPKRVRPTGALP